MKSGVSAVLCAYLIGASRSLASPVASDVFGTGVTYHGLYESGIEGFVGIKFAQSTAGKNRFRPPIPYTPEPNSDIQATDPGPSCPQRKSFGGYGPWKTYDVVHQISEDCLNLNVWRPNGTKAGDNLPVLVWIYGGSFITGNKDGKLMQPGAMQAQAIANGHPIMNVEINYRLGVFGFGQTEALINERSANAGVRDQRAALEWVQANIAAFGGDPNKVTIHGQSSGGTAVGTQILAYVSPSRHCTIGIDWLTHVAFSLGWHKASTFPARHMREPSTRYRLHWKLLPPCDGSTMGYNKFVPT